MAKLLCSLLILTIYFSGSLGASNKTSGRIIGGSYAKLGQYPYTVTIHEQGQNLAHLCTGVIIDRDWVLTVAHCVEPEKKYEIFAGSVNLDEKNYEQQVKKIEEVILDPDFVPLPPDFLTKHDFALLKVKSLRYDDFTKAVKFPKRQRKLPKVATISGWGSIDMNGTIKQLRLKHLNVTIPANQKSCGDYYPEFKTVNHICSSPPEDTPEGACFGDEGAPLMSKDIIYGIITRPDYPCGKHTPTIYGNIIDAYDFINRNTNLKL